MALPTSEEVHAEDQAAISGTLARRPVSYVAPVKITLPSPQKTRTNTALLAAMIVSVVLLTLFIVGMAAYFYRRLRLRQRRREGLDHDVEQVRTDIHQRELSHSSSSKYLEDLGRESKATLHSVASRPKSSFRSGNSMLKSTPMCPLHSMALMTRQKTPLSTESIDDSVREKEDVDKSAHSLQTLPFSEKGLTESVYVKARRESAIFDSDRCAFEEQEEETMWLPASEKTTILSTISQYPTDPASKVGGEIEEKRMKDRISTRRGAFSVISPIVLSASNVSDLHLPSPMEIPKARSRHSSKKYPIIYASQ